MGLDGTSTSGYTVPTGGEATVAHLIDNYLGAEHERINIGIIPWSGPIELTKTTRDLWIHTPAEKLPAIEKHLNTLVTDLRVNSSSMSQDVKLQKIGQIYWWTANGMFTHRGGAAISNTMLEVLARQHGIKTTAFRPDLSGDLAAFMTSEKTFVANLMLGKYGRVTLD
jgi:hypothetical protein